MSRPQTIALTAVLALAATVPAHAQQPPTAPASPAAASPPAAPPVTPYGAPISLEVARKAMAGAEAEAKKNNWPMAIAILDSGSQMVLFVKLDNTQHGSISAAIEKAKTSIDFRRPSKVFEDVVAQGGIGLRILGLRNAMPIEGGVPIVIDGKIVGSIGVSGGTAPQDGQVARAGADALK